MERVPFAELGEDLRGEIDNFIENNMGTIFHETAFNSISARAFGSEFSYFLARKDGRLMGICPCHSIKEGMLIHTYSNLTSKDMVYGGWVYDNGQISIEELQRGMKTKWNEALHYSSNIEINPMIPAKPGIIKRYTKAQTVILRLADASEEELFNSFKHSQKNKIRKAAKLGVTIEKVGPNGIAQFYELLAELKENLNKEYYPKEYFLEIFNHYYSQDRAACFIARYEGESISTLIILANKAFATIWFGGRKMGLPNNLYQNELMIWEAIKWAGSHGSEYFDLCTVDEERYANLSRIKLSFSKDVRLYYFYHKKGLLFRIMKYIERF